MNPLTFLDFGIRLITNNLDSPFSVSIDVTYKCNLNCRHCYFKRQKYKDEISLEKWIEIIEKLKKEHNILLCNWAGGEPLLRKDVVKKCKNYFDFNWITTNAIIELPKWRDCIFFVSIDGTKKYHEKIRGVGAYEKSKNNVLNSNNKIFLNTVINSQNHSCLEDMIKEWSGTNVRGVNFSFYIPLKKNDKLFIPPKERDKILNKVLELRKEYGGFILPSNKSLEMMKSYNYKKVIGENCLLKKFVVCIDPLGRKISPCAIGNADCSKCCQTIPYWLYSLVNKDLGTLMTTLKTTF